MMNAGSLFYSGGSREEPFTHTVDPPYKKTVRKNT